MEDVSEPPVSRTLAYKDEPSTAWEDMEAHTPKQPRPVDQIHHNVQSASPRLPSQHSASEGGACSGTTAPMQPTVQPLIRKPSKSKRSLETMSLQVSVAESGAVEQPSPFSSPNQARRATEGLTNSLPVDMAVVRSAIRATASSEGVDRQAGGEADSIAISAAADHQSGAPAEPGGTAAGGSSALSRFSVPGPRSGSGTKGPRERMQTFLDYLYAEAHPGEKFPTVDVVWGQTERDRV